jgi:hypothetical protein
MNLNGFQFQQPRRRSRRALRPVILGLEDRMMLAGGLHVPTQAINGQTDPLSVKRVPGYLTGLNSKTNLPYNNLATPYTNPVIFGHRIDDATVDYWEISLNVGDAVLVSLSPDSLPHGGNSPVNFVIRIWGPDGREILPANHQPVSGTALTYVATVQGNFTIGISTSHNAAYAFAPNAVQTPPDDSSPSLHVFTSTFSEYPGTNTSVLDVLQHYTGAGWPVLTGDELTAYSTLTNIAGAASNVPNTGIIDFSSFENIQGNPTISSINAWLVNTWAPFQAILNLAPDQNAETQKAKDVYQNEYNMLCRKPGFG